MQIFVQDFEVDKVEDKITESTFCNVSPRQIEFEGRHGRFEFSVDGKYKVNEQCGKEGCLETVRSYSVGSSAYSTRVRLPSPDQLPRWGH